MKNSLTWLVLVAVAFGGALAFHAVSAADTAPASNVCDRYADSTSGTDQAGALYGTVIQPYRTAQYLIDHLQPGEVGCLVGSPSPGGGAYDENLRLDLPGSPGAGPITLRSAPGQVATITGRITVPADARGATVSNLAFTPAAESTSSDPVVDIQSSEVVFSDNNVTSNASGTCVRLGNTSNRPVGVQLRRNRIHNCTTGVHLTNAAHTTVEYNLVYDNIDRGVRLDPDGDYSFIWRNILDRNGEGLSFVNSASQEPSSNMVRDNVITNSTARWNAASTWASGTPAGFNYFWRHCVSASNVDSRFNRAGGIENPTRGFGTYYPMAFGNPYGDPDATENKEFHIGTDTPCFELLEMDPYAVAISGGVPDDQEIDERPNILFIVTDDQRADTVTDLEPTQDANGDGNPANDYWMPKTVKWFRNGSLDNEVVAGGTQFDDAFATTPLCCPSRSSIFSGRYVHNTGVQSNDKGHRLNQSLTVQRYLGEPGQASTPYKTGVFGKFLNDWNLRRDPPHWDRWSIFTGGYTGNPGPTYNEDGTLKQISQYSTDYLADRVAATGGFIDEAENEDDRPWFLYVAPFAPHFPSTPDSQYAQLSVPPIGDDNPARKEGRLGENPLDDKPPWVRNWQDSGEIVQNGANPAQREQMLRSLKSVDDLVDDIFRKLEEKGEEKNTLAFFISDNGFHWREHGDWQKERDLPLASETPPSPPPGCDARNQCPGTGLYGKAKPYTDSIKIPYLVRWPANPTIRRGFVDEKRLLANIDLAPTAMDAANISPDAGQPMDGVSLLDRSLNRSELLTEVDVGTACSSADISAFPRWASLRSTDFHYIEYYEPTTGLVECADAVGNPIREYYDLRTDPFELDNILGDGNPLNDPDTTALHNRLQQARLCVGGTCPPGSNPSPQDPQPDVEVITAPDHLPVSRTVTLEASAFDNLGVHSVQFQIDGTDLGAPVTSPPWLATWDTAGLSGSHEVKAIARDDPQDTGVASAVNVGVDSTSPSGVDIQATDPDGVEGRPSVNDKITYSFSHAMDPGSFISGWDGTGSRTVSVTINNDVNSSPFGYGYQDTITVSGVDNNALGTVELHRSSFLNSYFLPTASYNRSLMTMSADRKRIEIVLRVEPGTAPPTSGAGPGGMTWVAAPDAAKASSGAYLCSCHVRESPTVEGTGKLVDDMDF